MLGNLFHMPVASSFRCVNGVSGATERGGPPVHFISSQYPKGILAHLKWSALGGSFSADVENVNRQGKQMTITNADNVN